jgi:hypothetical protein
VKAVHGNLRLSFNQIESIRKGRAFSRRFVIKANVRFFPAENPPNALSIKREQVKETYHPSFGKGDMRGISILEGFSDRNQFYVLSFSLIQEKKGRTHE